MRGLEFGACACEHCTLWLAPAPWMFVCGHQELPPCGFGRHGCGPMPFPVYGTKGCASLLQYMCYFQVIGIAIRAGFCLSRINMCADAVRLR